MSSFAMPVTETERRTVRTMCPMNCNPTYCGMVVEVEGDRVLSIRGDKANPDSRGFLCIRGQSAHEIIDNPLRILQPRERAHRGGETWQDTTWDGALDRVAAAIRRVGLQAVAVYHAHGLIPNTVHRQLVQRFTNLAGLQWWNPSIICWGLGAFGLSLTGPLEVNTKEDMAANSELIILWGANLASQPNTAPHVVAARKRGARVVAIDVRRSEAFAHADAAYLIRPGSDAALALAMIQVIIEEDRYDARFVQEHTTGFEALRQHVRPSTPEWAEGETGIAANEIRELARAYAATPRAMILLGGSSMHKTQNGWQVGRAAACLPGLTGALGQPGGGFGPRHAAETHGMGFANISAPERRPQGDYLVSEMSTVIDELERGRVKVLILLGTNMLSEFADIVLPGTSWLEETGYKVTNTHLYLMDQAIPARGETRTATQVMRGLADRLAIDDFYPWADTDALLSDVFAHPSTGQITPEQLRTQENRQALAISHVAHPDLCFRTPSGKVEFYSERAVELGLPALPVYEPPLEDARREPDRAARYPLIFRQGRTLTHFHSFYDHGRALPMLARALLTDRVPPGVVWMRDGWRGINDLTTGARAVPDAAARVFPAGSAAWEARVEPARA